MPASNLNSLTLKKFAPRMISTARPSSKSSTSTKATTANGSGINKPKPSPSTTNPPPNAGMPSSPESIKSPRTSNKPRPSSSKSARKQSPVPHNKFLQHLQLKIRN